MRTSPDRLSTKQRDTLMSVALVDRRHGWYRAASSGERVTLASLYTRNLLVRRAWRVGKSNADNAYEYRLTDVVREELERTIREIVERKP